MPRNDEPTRRLNPNETQEIIAASHQGGERADPLVGTRIGERYELLAPLGRGGFGRVYRARDLKLDRLVAVKLIEVGGTVGHETRMRALREARANARLQHLNADSSWARRATWLPSRSTAETSVPRPTFSSSAA